MDTTCLSRQRVPVYCRNVEQIRFRPLNLNQNRTTFWQVMLIVGLTSLQGLGQDNSAVDPAVDTHPVSLTSGDHVRHVIVGERRRTYIVHVPEVYDAKKPTPVVLALHGAGMNGSMMVWFTGLNKTSDARGFIVVYPSGTGPGSFLTWNSGGMIGRYKVERVDDVDFIKKLLDELATLVNVDVKRVYSCGMSNGGMMSYRLGVELSDRIAAIAPVGGTMAIDIGEPKHAVPVMHLHGTKDEIVPYGPPIGTAPSFTQMKGVEDSVLTWVKANGCDENPKSEVLSKEGDKTKVTRRAYTGSKQGADVALIVIEGGGHTWPGRQLPFPFLGRTARNISANELIWEFFQQYSLK
jgi:polyhydroxybutyrate depolymerase